MIVAWSPHIRAGFGSEEYYWLKTATLLPLVAAAIWFDWRTYLLRSFLALVLFGLYVIASRFWSHGSKYNRPRLLFQTCLIILLLPGHHPWYLAWIFPALGMGLSQLLDDERRLAPINVPAIILAFCDAIHSNQSSSYAISGFWLSGPSSEVSSLVQAMLAAVSALATWLFLGRYYKYGIQITFILMALFLSALPYDNPSRSLFPNLESITAILIFGTFLLPEEPASPKSLGAQFVFGLIAALVFFLFLQCRGWHYQALVFSALITSLFSSWLDEFSSLGFNIFKMSEDR